MEQFAVEPLFAPPAHAGAKLPFYTFTNSSAAMVATVALITAFFWMATRQRSVVPGRWQAAGEILYEYIAGLIRENIGKEGKPYMPFIFSLFMFILVGNFLGLLPWSFTFTSHAIVTASLAILIFVSVTIIGFYQQGTGYFRTFFPRGAPLASAIVLIPVEILSYLSRPLSLSVRLFVNMTVGHIIFTVLGGFVVALGGFYVVPGIVPLMGIVGMYLLEFLVAGLQAYVFTVLTCIYLHDAYHSH